jgi:hypothetical protein
MAQKPEEFTRRRLQQGDYMVRACLRQALQVSASARRLCGTRSHRFSLTTSFESITSDVTFTITNVYAPFDHDLTQDFITEMISLTSVVSGPWLILGDFNLIRVPSEKNNSNFNRALADAFNTMIHAMALFELPLLDRLFTWTNGQDDPILARLDRAFSTMHGTTPSW